MTKPSVKPSNKLIRKAFHALDAAKPSTTGLKGVKPSTTGLAGERTGRNIKDITKALREIEDGLKRIRDAKLAARSADNEEIDAGKPDDRSISLDSASIAKIKREAHNKGLKDGAALGEKFFEDGVSELEKFGGFKVTRNRFWDPLTKTYRTE